jgi:carbamate kinase
MPDRKRVVVAIGGNATHPENIRGTTEEQEEIAMRAGRALRPLVEAAPDIVITHGNGPVVGKILLRQYHAREHIPPMRLDVCVAHSQGGIGHLLMQGLEDEFARNEIQRRVVCLVTRVAVSADDPAFANPTKPIGPFFSAEEAADLQRSLGWQMREDAGRGWRYVVPSPMPKAILEVDTIADLAEQGVIVIAAGGGGIPMVHRADGCYAGVPAVVDKDLTSALLANQLDADTLLILTAVPRVAIRFGKADAEYLDRVRSAELAAYRSEGHFAKGSMGPKVDAALNFLARGGRRAVIAHLDEALAAFEGSAGTQVVA